MIPLFSTLEGAAILGERLTCYEPAGAVIVILGVAVAQGRVQLTRRRVSG